jgi:hypothetical protein
MTSGSGWTRGERGRRFVEVNQLGSIASASAMVTNCWPPETWFGDVVLVAEADAVEQLLGARHRVGLLLLLDADRRLDDVPTAVMCGNRLSLGTTG